MSNVRTKLVNKLTVLLTVLKFTYTRSHLQRVRLPSAPDYNEQFFSSSKRLLLIQIGINRKKIWLQRVPLQRADSFLVKITVISEIQCISATVLLKWMFKSVKMCTMFLNKLEVNIPIDS